MNIVKWYKNRSFQFKLVIGYLVLALIPMLCVTWYSYGKTRNVLLAEAYQSAEQEAERIEKNFLRWSSLTKQFWRCCMWIRC